MPTRFSDFLANTVWDAGRAALTNWSPFLNKKNFQLLCTYTHTQGKEENYMISSSLTVSIGLRQRKLQRSLDTLYFLISVDSFCCFVFISPWFGSIDVALLRYEQIQK